MESILRELMRNGQTAARIDAKLDHILDWRREVTTHMEETEERLDKLENGQQEMRRIAGWIKWGIAALPPSLALWGTGSHEHLAALIKALASAGH